MLFIGALWGSDKEDQICWTIFGPEIYRGSQSCHGQGGGGDGGRATVRNRDAAGYSRGGFCFTGQCVFGEGRCIGSAGGLGHQVRQVIDHLGG